jgi:acyl-CoA thioesterase-1
MKKKITITTIFITILILLSFLFQNNEKETEILVANNIQKETIVYDGKILAFGDSLTAGFGLEKQDNYPAQLQSILDEAGYSYKVINAGISGDTTAGGVRRIDWNLVDDIDIVILVLGGNDMLRGIDPESVKKNLDSMLNKISKSGAQIVLGGMTALDNLGDEYANEFNKIYPDLAEKYSVNLIPFF